MPNMEPITPEVPTMPNMEPSTPEVPTMPSMEPITPEVPTMPNMEPSIPEVPTVPSMESSTPEISNQIPEYEIPIVDTNEIPNIDNVQSPIINENLNTENNIASQNVGTTITAVAPNLRLALNTIRDCENTLEKYGFAVDVEEIDFEDSYQVIFKIEKQ